MTDEETPEPASIEPNEISADPEAAEEGAIPDALQQIVDQYVSNEARQSERERALNEFRLAVQDDPSILTASTCFAEMNPPAAVPISFIEVEAPATLPEVSMFLHIFFLLRLEYGLILFFYSSGRHL